MPITYNSSTNTITVTGFSESSPCTFKDIYNASVTNGWGVVDKPTDDSYVIRSKLVIGDGSTWTYFSDIRKTSIFTSDVTLDYGETLIDVKRHAYFRLGVGDVDKRSGTGGCVIDARDITVNSWSVLIKGEEESNVELYGSAIISERYQGLLNVLNLNGTIARVYDCLIQGGGSAVTPRPNLDMNHVTIEDASYGMSYGYQPAYPFTNIVIKFCYYGVYWYSDRVYNLNNAIFKDVEYIEILTASLSAPARLTDCELERWSINWGGSPTEDAKIERAYTFKVKVTDKDGNPIQNALVELYDKNGGLVFAELTNPNGETSEHSIVSITYTPTETIDNNPHTVRITKDGYTPLEVQITIDRTMKNLVWQLDALDYTLDEIMNELQAHRNAVEPNIDAQISSRASEATVQAIKAKTDNLQFDASNNVQARINDKGVLNDPSADEIADAVWDEVITDHQTAGTFGEKNQRAVPSENIDDYKANVSALALEATVQAIKAKTDNLPSDPASQSAIESKIDQAEANIRGADGDDLKAISDQLDAVQADLDNPDQYKADVSGLAKEATVQAIKAKTDNLPSDPASQSAIESKISQAEANIRGADNDDLKVLSDQLDGIQADLDNPDQYKADVSDLAKESTVQAIKQAVDFIKGIEGGRWKIENNQMIFYDEDNSTELARFDLFDKDGNPSEENVYERRRV